MQEILERMRKAVMQNVNEMSPAMRSVFNWAYNYKLKQVERGYATPVLDRSERISRSLPFNSVLLHDWIIYLCYERVVDDPESVFWGFNAATNSLHANNSMLGLAVRCPLCVEFDLKKRLVNKVCCWNHLSRCKLRGLLVIWLQSAVK